MGKNKYQMLIISIAMCLLNMIPQSAYCIDELFKRNGEAYISITGLTGSLANKNGIHRLNNPAEDSNIKSGGKNALGDSQNGLPSDLCEGKKPQRLLDTTVLNFAVDLNRVIYALVNKGGDYSGPGATIFRQVLDTTGGVTENQSDMGTGNYVHADHRGSGETTQPIYRTVASWTIDAQYGGRRYPKSYSGNWTTFEVRQGNMCPGGKLPEGISASDEMPDDPGFEGSSKILPVENKNWYEIPNKSWWSGWKTNRNNSNSYYVYRDVVTGNYIDWTLSIYEPGSNIIKYTTNTASSERLARTSSKSISRSVLAGCLDSCGVNGGSGNGKTPDLMCSVAFMPTGVGTNVRTYVYQRHEGLNDGILTVKGGSKKDDYIVGDLNGIGKNDTRFVGVSKSDNSTYDYIYLMGTSVIKKWIGKWASNIKDDTDDKYGISAVSVSNQWDEKGGIVFAFDPNNNQIYKIKFNKTAVDDCEIIKMAPDDGEGLLDKIGADRVSKIDDIATDGFGNLYLALTYPTKSNTYNVPKKLKYDVSKATSIKEINRVIQGPGIPDPDKTTITFAYKVQYKKDVWRISAIGQEPKPMSNGIVVGERTYLQKITFHTEEEKDLPSFSEGALTKSKAEKLENALSKLKTVQRDNFIVDSELEIPDANARISVINTPTPPEVYDLGENKSFLDIIGPYENAVIYSNKDKDTKLTKPSITSLSKGQTYFFYAENYPISAVDPDLEDKNQDPNTIYDIDEDTQLGGFISSTIGSTVKFDWKIWYISEFFSPSVKIVGGKQVQDANKDKVVPCYYSKDILEEEKIDSNGQPYIEYSYSDTYTNEPQLYAESDDNTPFITLHSPVPGKYIITCKANYKYYDYNNVKPGQTYSEWVKDSKRIKSDYALPSKPLGGNIDNYKSATLESKCYLNKTEIQKCLNSAVDKLFISSDYAEPSKIDEAKSNIKNYLWNHMTDEEKQYAAIMPVDIPGVMAPFETPAYIAKLQRAVKEPAANESKANNSWADVPTSPSYFSSSSEQDTYWRIELDEQAVFFSNNMSDKIGSERVCDKLAKRLLDPNDLNVYSGDAKKSLLFKSKSTEVASQMRWKNNSEVKANSMNITFWTTEGNSLATATKGISVKANGKKAKQDGKEYIYVKIPAGYAHATDPFVASITFDISRDIEYDLYVVNNRDLYDTSQESSMEYIMKKPIKVRRPITLTGKIGLMSVDTKVPRFEGGALSDNSSFEKQINGITGKTLSGKITFEYKDNSPFEKLQTLSSHPDCIDREANIEFNKNAIDNKTYENNKSFNFKPVFHVKNRKIELSLNLNGKTKQSTGAYKLYTTSYHADNHSLTPEDYKNNISVEEGQQAKNFGESTIKIKDFDVTKIYNGLLPLNYANNLAGYQPSRFDVCLTDSSGNVATYPLDLVLEVIDDVLPVPFAFIQEKKNNYSTIIPRITNAGGTESLLVASSNKNAMKKESLNSMKSAMETDANVVANYSSLWDFNSTENSYSHMGYNFMALPSQDSTKDSIKSIKDKYTTNSTFADLIKAKKIPPAIDALEGVDVIIKTYGVDNCGTSTTLLSYTYYDVEGKPKTYTSQNLLNGSSDIKNDKGLNALTNRVVYRKGGEGEAEFPYAAPIILTCSDNARTYDKYSVIIKSKKENGGVNEIEPIIADPANDLGKSKPNTRIIKTFIPVIGSELNIRTIEKNTRY